MGRGHAHSKMTSGCGGSHLKSSWLHKPWKAGQDGVQPWHSWAKKTPGTEVSDFSFFYFICGTIFTSHTLFCSSHLVIDDLPAHSTPFKWQIPHNELDSLSRTSCTHDLRPSGNVTHNVTRNVIDVASHSEDKLRHVTNRASVARVATLSTSRRDVVWTIGPWRRERRWVWPGTYYVNYTMGISYDVKWWSPWRVVFFRGSQAIAPSTG
jgi:hypothetical protein